MCSNIAQIKVLLHCLHSSKSRAKYTYFRSHTTKQVRDRKPRSRCEKYALYLRLSIGEAEELPISCDRGEVSVLLRYLLSRSCQLNITYPPSANDEAGVQRNMKKLTWKWVCWVVVYFPPNTRIKTPTSERSSLSSLDVIGEIISDKYLQSILSYVFVLLEILLEFVGA